MRPSRRVRVLAESESQALEQTYRATDNADLRTRCQMVLLSHEDHSTSQIAKIVRFSEDTVLYWIDRFETEGITGLEDRPRSGRPPKSR